MNEKKHQQRRRVCNSLYHRWWFRFILIIAGMDMFILGFSIAMGFDVSSYIPTTNIFFNLIVGFIYMFTASFLIHYSFDYIRFKRNTHFVCHHCGYVNNFNEDLNEEKALQLEKKV